MKLLKSIKNGAKAVGNVVTKGVKAGFTGVHNVQQKLAPIAEKIPGVGSLVSQRLQGGDMLSNAFVNKPAQSLAPEQEQSYLYQQNYPDMTQNQNLFGQKIEIHKKNETLEETAKRLWKTNKTFILAIAGVIGFLTWKLMSKKGKSIF